MKKPFVLHPYLGFTPKAYSIPTLEFETFVILRLQNCEWFSSSADEKPVEKDASSDGGDDDATFFKVLDRADIEGRVLDVSFVLKTVVVLTSVSSDGGGNNPSDTIKYTGDQGEKFFLYKSRYYKRNFARFLTRLDKINIKNR
jgi:hypothetical protein